MYYNFIYRQKDCKRNWCSLPACWTHARYLCFFGFPVLASLDCRCGFGAFCTLLLFLHGCQVAAEGQQDQLVLQRPVKSSSHHSSRHRNRERERDRDRDRDRDRNRERGRDRERDRDNTWPIEKHTNVQPQARNSLLFSWTKDYEDIKYSWIWSSTFMNSYVFTNLILHHAS